MSRPSNVLPCGGVVDFHIDRDVRRHGVTPAAGDLPKEELPRQKLLFIRPFVFDLLSGLLLLIKRPPRISSACRG